MGKDKDSSVFMKSEHVLYCFFLCCLFPHESIRKKIQYTAVLVSAGEYVV